MNFTDIRNKEEEECLLTLVFEAKTMRELLDIQSYIQFIFISRKKTQEIEKQNYNTSKLPLFKLINQTKLLSFTRSFTLTPIQLIKNLSLQTKIYEPEEPHQRPCGLSYLSCDKKYLDQDIKMLNACTLYLGYELAYFPYIKAMIRNLFIENSTLSTFPTEEGKIEIDSLHKSYRIKRIKQRPLTTFDPSECLVHDILRNESLNLINYTLEFNGNTKEKALIKEFINYYIREKNNEDNIYTKEWNILREEAILELFSKLIPQLKIEAIQDLKEKEEEYLIKNWCKSLNKIISQDCLYVTKIAAFVYNPESKEDVRNFYKLDYLLSYFGLKWKAN